MPVKDRISLPVANMQSLINGFRTMLNAYTTWDLAQPRPFGEVALIASLVWQTTIRPEVATGYSISVNQTVNPLMTDLDTANSPHEAGYLIRTPFALNLFDHPIYQRWHSFMGFVSRLASMPG